jgi:hypothetical protein
MIEIVALAVAVFVAAFAISTYEAWWTIGLVVIGVVVLGVDRSSLRRRDALLTVFGFIGSLVLAAAGLWMVVLGLFGNARPCDACFDNSVLFLPGLAVLVASIAIALVGLRSIARAFRSTDGAASMRDPAHR